MWFTMQVQTTFTIKTFQSLVRAADDQDLQRLISIIRNHTSTAAETDEAVAILRRRCRGNFYHSWKDVPVGVMRVVSTKQAEKDTADDFLVAVEAKGTIVERYESRDEICGGGGQWQEATTSARRTLDNSCLEARELRVFVGCVVRLTYNSYMAGPTFSQGQLAIVTHLPDPAIAPEIAEAHLRLLPPGCVDTTVMVGQAIKVKRRLTPAVEVGRKGLLARRQQWPFRLYVSTTIHRVIGETTPILATQLALSNSKFVIWEKEQLLVVLSRVRSLDNLYFVGQMEELVATVKGLLAKTDPTEVFLDQLLSGDAPPPDPRVQKTGFVTRSSEIPSWNCSCTYFLINNDSSKVYCGETGNMRARLRQHKTGTIFVESNYKNNNYVFHCREGSHCHQGHHRLAVAPVCNGCWLCG